MDIKQIELVKLKPYELNAKKHDKKQIENVAESIRQFGWQQPIVVDKDYCIIIGHCRYEAARLLGFTDVPVVVADNLNEDQVKKLRIIDNKSNESDWDLDLLLQDIDGLDFAGFDFDFGFDTPSDEDGDVNEDDFDVVSHTPEVAYSRSGDMYLLGDHRLLVGDSTKYEDVGRLMEGGGCRPIIH